MIAAFRQFVGRNAMMAYLVTMAPRLVELHRVLKPTGSLYLHCDPTASHYLKIVLDTVFGKTNFRNEVIWKRVSAHNSAKRFGPIHDTILFYGKTASCTWNEVYVPYDEEYVEQFYRHVDDAARKYTSSDLTGAGIRHGESGQPWRGINPTDKGRHWVAVHSTLDKWDLEGKVLWPSKGRVPRFKRFLDEMLGVRVQDMIYDINPVPAHGNERLGYATQKPEALLERIIQASSNEGDVVLDPFCGCGTAVAAAEKLKRQWIGIDITHLAVALMKHRLKTGYSLESGKDYDVVGEPQDVGSARALWEQDPYQFQYWAVSLLEAQPQGEQKRGADRAIDGLVYFIDGQKRTPHKVVVQVKGGRVSSPQIRDLKGVVERENAALGLFITLEEPTRDMRTEAASGGFFHSELWDRDFPKIQVRTVSEILAGQGFELPPSVGTAYQPAQRVRRPQGQQTQLEGLETA